MNFKVVIPARYASTRLPGKALLQIHGKPIIQFVYENAIQSGAEEVIIATDDERISNAAKEFNANVCMTLESHRSGTDRIAEVAQVKQWAEETIIVNVQGDEPMMPSENIKQVAKNLANNPEARISTLCENISNDKDYENPNVVKVAYDRNNLAINFSRDVSTFNTIKTKEVFRHLGIYSYSSGYLKKFTQLEVSSSEKKESLEQLRAMDNGDKIFVELSDKPTGIGVDTQEDYEKLLSII